MGVNRNTNNNYNPTTEMKFDINLQIKAPDSRERKHIILYFTTKDIKLRWFQYRLTHIILHKIGINQANNCFLCNKEADNLTNLFLNCTHIHKLQMWLKFYCSHLNN